MDLLAASYAPPTSDAACPAVAHSNSESQSQSQPRSLPLSTQPHPNPLPNLSGSLPAVSSRAHLAHFRPFARDSQQEDNQSGPLFAPMPRQLNIAERVFVPEDEFNRRLYSSSTQTDSSGAGSGNSYLALAASERERKQRAKVLKRRRKPAGRAGEGGLDDISGDLLDDGDGGAQRSFAGPWAGYESVPTAEQQQQEQQQQQDLETGEDSESRKRLIEVSLGMGDGYGTLDGRKSHKSEDERVGNVGGVVKTRSTFHGGRLFDYQGKSYIRPPPRLVPKDHECFLPKRKLHTYSGHTDGVNSIALFPRYGHLLLSGSLDTTVRLWSTCDDRRLLRTFFGHSRAVKGAAFSPHDGKRCLSYGYDRLINMWDTETGACVSSYTPPGGNATIPNCVVFHPQREHEHVIMAGCSDKRIYQFDTRSGSVVQTYDEHIGPVNTLTWIERGKKFVSSSDDKSLRLWEFGYPVVVKHISEFDMHSMPAVTHHPTEQAYAAQSLDNTVLVYSTKEREKYHQIKKMTFRGHNTAGYACQLAFSPDGHYMASGTAGGSVVFWDWTNQRKVRELDAHTRGTVCIGVQWHPIEPSQLFTAGWDKKIHHWT